MNGAAPNGADNGDHAKPSVPAFLESRGYRTAFAGCFVVIVASLLIHMSLGRGFREPSVWSFVAATAALVAAFVIPWLATHTKNPTENPTDDPTDDPTGEDTP